MARMLAVFDIVPAKDENGKPMLPDWKRGTSGIVSRPYAFSCVLVPRNEEMVELAVREADNADEQLKGWL